MNKVLAEALRKGFMAVKQQEKEQEKDKPDAAGQPEQPQQQAMPQPRVAGFQRPAAPVITPAVQAGILSDAIKRTEDAIADENRSRVSQLREMRRMEHEKDIEQIRAQSMLERVRQARMAEDMANGVLAPGLVDLTGTARRIS